MLTLAAAAVGEKLTLLGTEEPILCSLAEMRREFAKVQRRRSELDHPYLIDHISFG